MDSRLLSCHWIREAVKGITICCPARSCCLLLLLLPRSSAGCCGAGHVWLSHAPCSLTTSTNLVPITLLSCWPRSRQRQQQAAGKRALAAAAVSWLHKNAAANSTSVAVLGSWAGTCSSHQQLKLSMCCVVIYTKLLAAAAEAAGSDNLASTSFFVPAAPIMQRCLDARQHPALFIGQEMTRLRLRPACWANWQVCKLTKLSKLPAWGR